MTWVVGACVWSTWCYAQFLPPASNDIKLQVTKQEIDEDAAGRPEALQMEAVAKQFRIDPHLVEDLRARKLGWGEITIQVVLAQELHKLVPNSYPNLVQTLLRIGDLRKHKQSWGQIANEVGIDLAPVVAEGQRARQELRAKTKTNAEGDDRRGRGAGSGTGDQRN